jgi:dinuclear metal center YbgI/SA1388 family protein
MVASRDEIVSFCDELLAAGEFEDYGPNGLQVPGTEAVELVVTGVSAQRELFERAASEGAQMVLVHHGILWEGQSRVVTPALKDRLAALFGADLSLVAYHLPLDAHREIGNNALLCHAFGFEPTDEPFGVVKGRPIGVIGRGLGIEASALITRVESLLGQSPVAFAEGPDQVRSLGIVSGGGQSAIREAVSLGLDAFLTGEPAEYAMAEARESGIHFIAAGHYATETLGIRRLGELVAERFGVEHRFLDIPNPV